MASYLKGNAAPSPFLQQVTILRSDEVVEDALSQVFAFHFSVLVGFPSLSKVSSWAINSPVQLLGS
ncbi:hypothetical protein D9M68_996130 [compost metagenome]